MDQDGPAQGPSLWIKMDQHMGKFCGLVCGHSVYKLIKKEKINIAKFIKYIFVTASLKPCVENPMKQNLIREKSQNKTMGLYRSAHHGSNLARPSSYVARAGPTHLGPSPAHPIFLRRPMSGWPMGHNLKANLFHVTFAYESCQCRPTFATV